MIDQISIQRAETLHPAVREDAIKILELADKELSGRAMLRYAEVTRTFPKQALLYAQGRQTAGTVITYEGQKMTVPSGGIVTYAQPGYSYHNYGLAIDIVLIIDGKSASWDTATDYDNDKISDWQEVVKLFENMDWEWGGKWVGKKRDLPHFQKTFGLKESELLRRYNAKDFITGTQYVRL